MADPSPEPRPSPLQAFRDALAGGSVPGEDVLSELLEQGLMEQALLELKRKRPRTGQPDPWRAVCERMEKIVATARERRLLQWQLDPARRTYRLRLGVRRPASDLHPPALQSALAAAIMEAGLPLAMGLEKTPRPLVRLGHPLPPGVEGFNEWADMVLREPPGMPAGALAERINARCAPGLQVLHAVPVPNHASPVLDLCLHAHWSWSCPEPLRPLAEERLARFAAATTWTISKTGKVDGHKQEKQVEVRDRVLSMDWDGGTLHFITRLAAGEALNPVKLLAGVLGVEATTIGRLARTMVELAADPRLEAAGKYETKLHNIYEDAVLLDADPDPEPAGEEDDDVILLERDTPEA